MYNVYSVSLLLFTNAVMAAKARYFALLIKKKQKQRDIESQ